MLSHSLSHCKLANDPCRDLVSAFIAQYGVDAVPLDPSPVAQMRKLPLLFQASAEGALRGLPPDAQRQVVCLEHPQAKQSLE